MKESARDHAERPWLVYFASGNYWTGNPTGRHHLLWQLQSRYRILFVNSLGLANIRAIRKSTLLGRIRTRVISTVQYIRRDKGFTVFSPIRVPIGGRWGRVLEDRMLRTQFRGMFRFLRIDSPYVLVSSPAAARVLPELGFRRLMYLYSDRFVAYREIANRAKVEMWDRQLQEQADVIVSNLQKTTEILKQSPVGGKVHYVPHSVDFELFNAELARDTPLPTELNNIPRPIVGYYGTLRDSNDWAMMASVATARPNYSFVFIGRERADINPRIRECSNAHFLGFKPYETLPKYLKFFDLCVMFWRVTEWIYNSSPLKTKEFLAMGKPIVSVPIYELEQKFSDVIRFASDSVGFVRCIDEELKNDSVERRAARIERVRRESWGQAAKTIAALLEAP